MGLAGLTTLGISFGYHDSAIALVRDGKILYAAQEERFSRKKADAEFPRLALANCFNSRQDFVDVDCVAFYENSKLRFERQAAQQFHKPWLQRRYPGQNRLGPIRKSALVENISKALSVDPDIVARKNFLWSEHHLSHAASAFLPSSFDSSATLTIDGVGEWATTTIGIGSRDHTKLESGETVRVLQETHFPNSIGLLYSAFTALAGFKINSGEYKLMGLAPYGLPVFKEVILTKLVNRRSDGSWTVATEVFDYWATGFVTPMLESVIGVGRRHPDDEIRTDHFNLAASIQGALNEIVLDLSQQAMQLADSQNLCLAGGVALNCVTNGFLKRAGITNVWIQPAAGDAGGALGSALLIDGLLNRGALSSPKGQRTFTNSNVGNRVPPKKTSASSDTMEGALLGPEYRENEVVAELERLEVLFEEIDDFGELARETASQLANGKVVGWFQGRMEFGPRALGNRSILADPRSKSMQSRLNNKTKKRESFRPFAPAVLDSYSSEFFESGFESPYMLFTDFVRGTEQINGNERSSYFSEIVQEALSNGRLPVTHEILPAITHVDGTARVQTVTENTNPKFFNLIECFRLLTGIPVLINTSFNVRGEPIVGSVEDAVRCFASTDIDTLVIENCIVRRSEQHGLDRLKADDFPDD